MTQGNPSCTLLANPTGDYMIDLILNTLFWGSLLYLVVALYQSRRGLMPPFFKDSYTPTILCDEDEALAYGNGHNCASEFGEGENPYANAEWRKAWDEGFEDGFREYEQEAFAYGATDNPDRKAITL